MDPSNRRLLLLLLLLSLGLRTVFGAPCCIDSGLVAETDELAHHAALADSGDTEHSGHGDAPTANPCCSACGPTLSPETIQFVVLDSPRERIAPAPVRSLATRPPFFAYDATAPPALI